MEIQPIKIKSFLKSNSLEKRVTAQNKMVPIMQIDLPDDVLRHMATFLFHDIRSKAYKEKEETDLNKALMRYIVRIAFTEENCRIIFSFYHQSFYIHRYHHISQPHCVMQIGFCNFCGNYRYYQIDAVRCKCPAIKSYGR